MDSTILLIPAIVVHELEAMKSCTAAQLKGKPTKTQEEMKLKAFRARDAERLIQQLQKINVPNLQGQNKFHITI